MIFSVRAIIASLSRGMTLEPGDVIATGTPDGVGFARTPPEFLEDGDIVEVDIDAIGTLRNTIALTKRSGCGGHRFGGLRFAGAAGDRLRGHEK